MKRQSQSACVAGSPGRSRNIANDPQRTTEKMACLIKQVSGDNLPGAVARLLVILNKHAAAQVSPSGAVNMFSNARNVTARLNVPVAAMQAALMGFIALMMHAQKVAPHWMEWRMGLIFLGASMCVNYRYGLRCGRNSEYTGELLILGLVVFTALFLWTAFSILSWSIPSAADLYDTATGMATIALAGITAIQFAFKQRP